VRIPLADPTEANRTPRALIVAVALACAALALLLTTAPANAKPGYLVIPGRHEVELNLKGSHGYAIQVSKSNRFVEVFVNKGPSVAVYAVRHRQAKDAGIDAEFPGIGRVSVEFHPIGRPHREAGFFPPCKGGKTTKQRGYFQGVIRIRGERGYTSVHTNRAPGEVVTVTKEICKRSIFNPSKPEPEGERTRLFATSGPKRGRSVAFWASTLSAGTSPVTSFSGYAAERRRGMTIFREVSITGATDDLSLSDAGNYPASAKITPPAPFHGSADFLRNPGGENSWAGPLSVDLPGLGRVDLAGPSFSAKLCRNSGCRPSRDQIVSARGLVRGRVPAGLG
jgi:hypothetical protein